MIKLTFIFVFFSFVTKGQSENPPESLLSGDGIEQVFNAAFDYKTHNFSGLLVVKNEHSKYHIVLVSKMGLTLMDFVVTDNALIWNKIPSYLDRKTVKKILEQDFRLVFLTALNFSEKIKKIKGGLKIGGKHPVKIRIDNDHTILDATTARFISFFKARALYDFQKPGTLPREICLSHRFIKMEMVLHPMEKER